MPQVYDDEKEKEAGSSGSHDDLGVHPERREAETAELEKKFAEPSAKKEFSSDDLKTAEESGDTGVSSAIDKKEASLTSDDDTVGKGYQNESKRKAGRFLGSGKSRVAAGIITGVVVGGGIFGFLQAPNLAINHLRELLLTKVSQLQNHHTLKYRRKTIHKVGDLFTKDGRRGGKIIAEMERRGYKFSFDSSGRMAGITLPDGRSSIPAAGIADHLNDYLEVAHPLRTSKWKTRRMEAFYNRYKVTRRPVVVRVDGDPEDPERAVNKKMFQDVYGEDVTVDPRGRIEGQEGETDEQAAAREQANAENESLARGDGSLEDLKQKLRDGTPIEELTPDEQNLLRIGAGIDDELLELAERGFTGSISGKVFDGFKSVFSTTDILDKICTVKNRMTAIQVAARHFRALSMLRYASSFVKAADKTRAGKLSPGSIDPKMMNALLKRTTAVDANGNSLGASPGFAYILKGKFSKSKNDAFKGSFGVDGKLTGFPKAMQDSTSHFPGMSKCGIIQNPITQVGAAVVELGIGIFTGGTSKAATEGAKTTATVLIKDALRNLLTKQTAKQVAKSVLIEISFEGMMALTQMYAEKSMAISFSGQEKGGELGDILGGGAGTLNKQRSFQGGLVPATSSEYEEANRQYVTYRKEQLKSENFATRMFDYENTDSLAFQAMSTFATAPLSLEGLRSTTANNFGSLLGKLFNAPSLLANSAMSQSAYAQSPDEVTHETYTTSGGAQLATDPAGNLLPIMRSDIESIDPITNIDELVSSNDINSESLEPSSERFIEHIKNCVEEVDTITTLDKEDQTDPKYDCLASQPITKKFKAHLAYIDMLDGLDAILLSDEISSNADAFGVEQYANALTDQQPEISCAYECNKKPTDKKIIFESYVQSINSQFNISISRLSAAISGSA